MKKVILSIAMIAFGTFAMAQENQMARKMDPAQMEQKRADQLQNMKTELNLTDAQVAKIKALQDEKIAIRKANEPKLQAEKKAKMEAMKEKREEYNNQMKQILTPEQYAKWDQKRAERMKKKADIMRPKKDRMMIQPAK